MISKLRILTIAAAVALAAVVAPATALGTAPAAQAAGDVCDICSINFDLGACEALGGYSYDSTVEPPPPALSAPKPPAPAPAPAAPAPATPAPQAPAPAAPAPAPAPAKQGTGGAVTTGTEVATNVAATVPSVPTALKNSIKDRALTLNWVAPADGGSPITGYTLVLNGGAPLALPADATSYTITLGAGSYEVALSASNAVGASEEVAVLSDIVIEATPKVAPSAEAAAATAGTDAGVPAPLVGGIVLGALVLLAGGALGWWALRRRATAS